MPRGFLAWSCGFGDNIGATLWARFVIFCQKLVLTRQLLCQELLHVVRGPVLPIRAAKLFSVQGVGDLLVAQFPFAQFLCPFQRLGLAVGLACNPPLLLLAPRSKMRMGIEVVPS